VQACHQAHRVDAGREDVVGGGIVADQLGVRDFRIGRVRLCERIVIPLNHEQPPARGWRGGREQEEMRRFMLPCTPCRMRRAHDQKRPGRHPCRIWRSYSGGKDSDLAGRVKGEEEEVELCARPWGGAILRWSKPRRKSLPRRELHCAMETTRRVTLGKIAVGTANVLRGRKLRLQYYRAKSVLGRCKMYPHTSCAVAA